MKTVIFSITVLLACFAADAALTISSGDIQYQANIFSYTYSLTFADLAPKITKFEDDVSSMFNITVHTTPLAIPPAEPDPRWICAAAGQKEAEFVYIFDFSNLRISGFYLRIISVELRDKFVMMNNKALSEDSYAGSYWSTDGTNWNEFNTASSPSSLTPYVSVVNDTVELPPADCIDRFYYKVVFSNKDLDGFDQDMSMWNYLSSDQSDNFDVKFNLAYETSLAGIGSWQEPFLISTPEDLIYLGENPALYDFCFHLTNDIDMAGYGPFERALIAPDTVIVDSGYTFDGTPFTGTINGRGFAIRNFSIDNTAASGFLGLIGYTGTDFKYAFFYDLRLSNVELKGGGSPCRYFGGLIGCATLTSLENCHVDGKIQSGNSCTGGIAGFLSTGGTSLKKCSSNIIIESSESRAGGPGWQFL
jgi:hypothetical protein